LVLEGRIVCYGIIEIKPQGRVCRERRVVFEARGKHRPKQWGEEHKYRNPHYATGDK
jgi:hypothetical protein